MTDQNQSLSTILENATKALNEGKTNGGQPLVEDGGGNVARYAEALAEMVIRAGAYARDHGLFIERTSNAFIERLDHLVNDYATNLLAAERRKMVELEKILGKASDDDATRQ